MDQPNDNDVLLGDGAELVLNGVRFRLSEPVRRVARRMLKAVLPTCNRFPKDVNGNITTEGLDQDAAFTIYEDLCVLLESVVAPLADDADRLRIEVNNATNAELFNALSIVLGVLSRPLVSSAPTVAE